MSTAPFVLLLLCATAAASAGRLHTAAVQDGGSAATAFPFLGDTIHDILPTYGLPRGLLPESVTNYYLIDKDHFVVELAAPCYVMFTDLVYYDRVIKGKISYGSITDISGVQVQKFFVWLSVTGMVADADDNSIEFQVGFLSEKLPASMFAKVPSCRKGSVGCQDGAAAALAAV